MLHLLTFIVQTGKGAFQSHLVLSVFASHLKQVEDSKFDWGPPAGGLALCVAAVSFYPHDDGFSTNTLSQLERALTLSKQYGHLDFSKSNDITKKQREFAELNWGAVARGWFQKTSMITQSRWDCIIYDAKAFISGVDDEDAGANDIIGAGLEVDPRTLVELD